MRICIILDTLFQRIIWTGITSYLGNCWGSVTKNRVSILTKDTMSLAHPQRDSSLYFRTDMSSKKKIMIHISLQCTSSNSLFILTFKLLGVLFDCYILPRMHLLIIYFKFDVPFFPYCIMIEFISMLSSS